MSRLTTNRPDEALTSSAANGLWSCQLNAGFSTAVPVGIYTRGGGKCVIVAAEKAQLVSGVYTLLYSAARVYY